MWRTTSAGTRYLTCSHMAVTVKAQQTKPPAPQSSAVHAWHPPTNQLLHVLPLGYVGHAWRHQQASPHLVPVRKAERAFALHACHGQHKHARHCTPAPAQCPAQAPNRHAHPQSPVAVPESLFLLRQLLEQPLADDVLNANQTCTCTTPEERSMPLMHPRARLEASAPAPGVACWPAASTAAPSHSWLLAFLVAVPQRALPHLLAGVGAVVVRLNLAAHVVWGKPGRGGGRGTTLSHDTDCRQSACTLLQSICTVMQGNAQSNHIAPGSRA